MTRPETCSAAGGAISMWAKVTDCPSRCGIVSSFQWQTGSVIYYLSSDIRYDTHVLTNIAK